MSKAELLTDPLCRAAFCLAIEAHGTQKRKYVDEPYWIHPMNVADDVARIEDTTPVMVAAAYCHDLIEDTGIDRDYLLEHALQFGTDDAIKGMEAFPIQDVKAIVALVSELSNPSRLSPYNKLPRAERKKIDREHIAKASKEARIIKIFDRIDNLIGLCEVTDLKDIEFANLYIEESQLLHDALRETDPSEDFHDYLELLMNYIEQAKL